MPTGPPVQSARPARESVIRWSGCAASLVYGAAIVWLFASQPATMSEVSGGLAASVGLYRVDQARFEEGLRYFRGERFPEARAAFAQADPASRDAVTQFYVAYAFYRQGWGRFSSDDALFQQAVSALDRAVAASPGGRVVVDDPNLGLRTADELRAELEHGLTREWSDLNPMRVFRARQ